MPRILTLFLMLHWATVFTLLAAFSIADSAGLEGLRAFGVDLAFDGFDGRKALVLQAVVSFAFTICAVLFWWSLATLVASLRHEMPQGEEVLRVAFSAAACLMTLILVAGALAGADHLLPVMATHVAALIASYVATQAELAKMPLEIQVSEEELRLAARVRVLDASKIASLVRFSPNTIVSGRFER